MEKVVGGPKIHLKQNKQRLPIMHFTNWYN